MFFQKIPNIFTKSLSIIAGVVLALCIGVSVRMVKGHAPGLPPRPFENLLGEPAPTFELQGLDGQIVSLQNVDSGDVRLLFFADSTCKACDITFPAIKKVAEEISIIIVGVGDREVLMHKLSQHDIAVPTGYDELTTVKQLYGVKGFPCTMLIDQKGIVLDAAYGSKGVEHVMQTYKKMKKGGA